MGLRVVEVGAVEVEEAGRGRKFAVDCLSYF